LASSVRMEPVAQSQGSPILETEPQMQLRNKGDLSFVLPFRDTNWFIP